MIVIHSIVNELPIEEAIEKGKQLRAAREKFWRDRGATPMPYGYVLHRLEQMHSRKLLEGEKDGSTIGQAKS